MCGICGIVYTDPERRADPGLLERMARVQNHRGPDDQGIWCQGNVGLGHVRLSIIDLSPLGHQPMTNEDQSVWVTFNGEIYNFLELREELRQKGHQFRSRTDTEVLVHLWEEEGVRCVERLRGMFAFAVWAQDPLQVGQAGEHPDAAIQARQTTSHGMGRQQEDQTQPSTGRKFAGMSRLKRSKKPPTQAKTTAERSNRKTRMERKLLVTSMCEPAHSVPVKADCNRSASDPGNAPIQATEPRPFSGKHRPA